VCVVRCITGRLLFLFYEAQTYVLTFAPPERKKAPGIPTPSSSPFAFLRLSFDSDSPATKVPFQAHSPDSSADTASTSVHMISAKAPSARTAKPPALPSFMATALFPWVKLPLVEGREEEAEARSPARARRRT
jgi:hypothetical protein